MPELEEETVLGIDNIPLDLPIAGVASRSLAAALDYLVVTALLMIWVFGSLALLGASHVESGWWVVVVVVFGSFLIYWGYFSISELATHGRTLGKMALGLRVETRDGGTPGSGALLVRNLVRSIDLLVGVLMMAADPLARRLGDRLAGTLVVHDERRDAGPLLGRVPSGWGPREVAVAEAFLARSASLEPAQARHLARRLLAAIERDAPELAAEVAGLEDEPVLALRRALWVAEG
jgi:uncharacterized RDD family membrane protein YckC